ncbi:helix-turn-helix domain-containing protein [Paraclostridium sordellii]|uniref:helix-turn-helix domain-containing protein n=1 Tax=Paraclostridium sordellii TaxID=1505 RepID=UPI0005E7E478|nr:helix-turn-helix transcriptional regulator [Paeniclostridium sordellii]CEO27371.1 transcriptional regulator [[Clostridium] sordellii] [Paeniclostridium sordellii]
MNYKPNTKLIKLHMLKKGYSITKLAKKSNLGKSTVSRLINQIGTPRIETIYKIAKALDIEIKDITL